MPIKQDKKMIRYPRKDLAKIQSVIAKNLGMYGYTKLSRDELNSLGIRRANGKAWTISSVQSFVSRQFYNRKAVNDYDKQGNSFNDN